MAVMAGVEVVLTAQHPHIMGNDTPGSPNDSCNPHNRIDFAVHSYVITVVMIKVTLSHMVAHSRGDGRRSVDTLQGNRGSRCSSNKYPAKVGHAV